MQGTFEPPPVVSNPEPVVERIPQVTFQQPPVNNPDPIVQTIPWTPERLAPEPVAHQTPETPGSPSFTTPPTTPITTPPPRRSTRVSRPPDRWGYDRF